LELYFAYGSNLLATRMQERVPGARCGGRASLAGYALVFDKRGRDRSAKANLRCETGRSVQGVVYELPPGGFAALDAFEPGYARLAVEVRCEADGALHRAQTYCSDERAPELRAQRDYLELVLAGARAHGLPEEWLREIARAAGELQPAGSRR
jgi:gamma-glutamylcyclotransferase (GGCT)/AIG2-like uncharacterized protein YtfP